LHNWHLINWTNADLLPQMGGGNHTHTPEDFIPFNEPHPYPLRSLAYGTEHVSAYDMHRVIMYSIWLIVCGY